MKLYKTLLSIPRRGALYLLDKYARYVKSDVLFLKWKYRLLMGKKLNLDNPQTFNEKLQWLKLYDRKPIYSQMVDKIEVKKIVASIIGEEFIIPTIETYDSPDDINFDLLPNQFVIKCSHDSGGLVVCEDKSKIDIQATKKLLRQGLNRCYYYENREWPYLNVVPRLICERYLEDESGSGLKDYKWFCFDGLPKAMFIAADRGNPHEDTKFDFYDMNFNHLPFLNGHPNNYKITKKPIGFEKMKALAAKLSQGIPQVRVDFYDINGQIFFGEITFSHWSGFVPFEPLEWDYTFGSWINLPLISK